MENQKKPLHEVSNVSVKVQSKLPKLSRQFAKRKAGSESEAALFATKKVKTGNKYSSNYGNPTVRSTVPKKPAVTSIRNEVCSGINRNQKSKPPGKPTAGKSTLTKPAPGADIQGKKRQPWDLKGKLQDMVEQNAKLVNELNQYKQSKAAEMEQLQLCSKQQIKELEQKIKESNRELEQMRINTAAMEATISQLNSDLVASREQYSHLKASVDMLSSEKGQLTMELTSTKNELKELKLFAAKQTETIQQQNEKLIQNESDRRVLHNIIQELKGNIRVFCRVRPLLNDELSAGNAEIRNIEFPDKSGDKKVIELKKVGEASSENNVYEFNFDRVFAPKCTQEEVFEEISQLVQSALDGYHVCIFAYGQTGSGKTYTMEGPNLADEETRGMIPRAVNQVFVSSQALKDKGWQYEMEVSFLEIYNETIRDLLGNGQDDNVKHEIKMASANSMDVVVTNLTSVKVKNLSEVYKLLSKASDKRAVAETNCNLQSSRSHSVFQMKISGHNTVTDERCMGLLNLIDLAGSERLKISGSQGLRLKETQCINKSLSNLCTVIMALVNKDSHIPYRNSKLTYLLQHCLGGNSKVLMFVNVSPKEECFSETLNSLRFASLVNSCNIGTATRRIK